MVWDGVTRVYDPQGVERDMGWLEQWFGVRPEVVRAPVVEGKSVWRCTELRTKDGEAAQVVYTRDYEDGPVEGIEVARWWSTAPELKERGPDCVVSRYEPLGVIGVTDGPEADVGFGMGGDDCPPGSSAVWVEFCGMGSDGVRGLGWGVGENHRVVRPVFRVVRGEDPDPEPEADLVRIAEALEGIGAELMWLREMLGKGWNVRVGE